MERNCKGNLWRKPERVAEGIFKIIMEGFPEGISGEITGGIPK